MKKLLVVTFFALALHTAHAQKTGIGYTQKNLETGVGKGGHLRIIETGCDCRKFERTSDNRCINCLYRQIDSPITHITQKKP